jgi:DNA-binding transcriptional ArsR family regulator
MTRSPELIEHAARRFALLGDPTRLRILHVLMEQGELAVGEIAAQAGTSRFNASAHLNRLLEASLVARRREGTSVYYRTDDEKLPAICQWMCESLRTHARDLAGVR